MKSPRYPTHFPKTHRTAPMRFHGLEFGTRENPCPTRKRSCSKDPNCSSLSSQSTTLASFHQGQAVVARGSSPLPSSEERTEFHFRYSLGMVSYHLGSESISHQEYMCSVLGKPGLSHYPGFSSEPLDVSSESIVARNNAHNSCGSFAQDDRPFPFPGIVGMP